MNRFNSICSYFLSTHPHPPSSFLLTSCRDHCYCLSLSLSPAHALSLSVAGPSHVLALIELQQSSLAFLPFLWVSFDFFSPLISLFSVLLQFNFHISLNFTPLFFISALLSFTLFLVLSFCSDGSISLLLGCMDTLTCMHTRTPSHYLTSIIISYIYTSCIPRRSEGGCEDFTLLSVVILYSLI